MGQLDRARQTLNVSSKKSAKDALSAAQRAVDGIGSVGTTRLRISHRSASGFTVDLKPTVLGALHGSGQMDVRVEESQDGGSKVTARFTSPVVTQSKLLGFIPMGPKSVMGLKAYERSIAAIRTAV